MSQISHAYFGELDSDSVEGNDVIWEQTLSLNGEDVEVALWVDKGTPLKADQLDGFAGVLQNLTALDAQKRAELTQFLEHDNEFIRYYVEAVQEGGADDLVAVKALIEEAHRKGLGEVQATDFVKSMRLTDIALWCAVDSDPIVLDYRIDPDTSDQILAAQCDEHGNLVEISWES